jgi:nucleotide-binding universal stress UspA family protein
MFTRILFPTDFSAYANAVFACLPELKAAGVGEVVLLSVIRPSDVPMPETVNRESLEYWKFSLEEQMNVARMALEGKGLRVVTRVEYGHPVEQILQVAADERVDLIVMGAQGMTAAQELLIGSTAYEVVRRATLPVLLQKAEVVRELGHVKCQTVCKTMFTHILHPTDFSECAEAAFQVVKRLKSAGTKRVTILHVQDERNMRQRPAEQIAEFDRHDTERLEKLCKSLMMFGLQAHPLLRHGIPFRETLRVADEIGAGLIVLGSHGKSAVQEMLAGSTLENVVRLSRQAVLVIRPQQKEMV